MRVHELKAMLAGWSEACSHRDRAAADALGWSAPEGFSDISTQREPYVIRLCEVLHRVHLSVRAGSSGPLSHLTIGGLLGTLESFYARCFPPILDRIVVCDVDLESYNPRRDMGSYCYRNVCGTEYGRFCGQFVYLRDDSKETLAQQALRALGPFATVFVDGEHTREAVISDMSLAASCLAPGGVILVHDLELFSSSVPEGYLEWVREHPEWEHAEVPGSDLMMGLGLVQRRGEG